MFDHRTHELKLYAGDGRMLMHLWFDGGHSMQMDLDVALRRRDVAFVDLIDRINDSTERLYPSRP